MGFVAWEQSHWWRAKEDYAFGWLVPLFVVYVVSDRWPNILSAFGATTTSNSISRTAPVSSRIELLLAWTGLGGGATFFLLGALYRAAAGPTYPGTLATTLGMSTTALSALYLAASPMSNSADASVGETRRRIVGLFVFPVLVWLISAPLLAGVENGLNVFLMHQITSTVFSVFDLLGLPLEQRGNILVLPRGNVGVAEACSGIRSLTGCLFAGCFLASMFVKGRWRKATLIVTALAFAFATNLLRSLFLTAWSYRYGSESMEHTVHDASGYAVLGLTVIGLMIVLPYLNPSANTPRNTSASPPNLRNHFMDT